MVDIHCHILPELDDGAKDMETAVAMCKMAAEDGIKASVVTPHANDRYPFDPDVVERKIEEVTAQSGGVLKLLPGCDFHLSYDNIQSALADPHRYTINHGHYLLVEFADFAIPPNIEQVFFQFRTREMIPIVTHPERNPWLLSQKERLFEWVEAGALIQVTAGSLAGRFGKAANELGRWLLDHQMLHFVASDAHNITSRPPVLSIARQKVAHQFGEQAAEMIFEHFPQAVINNETFEAPQPLKKSSRTFFTRLTASFRRQ